MNLRPKDDYDRAYRKIHAMYMKGYTNEEIYRECSDMQKWEVLEIIQTIWGREQVRKERRGESE